jgi:hypothetical protein
MSDPKAEKATTISTAVAGKRFEWIALLRGGEETGWVCLQESDMAFIESGESDCYESLQMWRSRAEAAEAKLAELERRGALLTAFVVAEDAWNAHAECSYCWDEDDELYWQMMNARAALDWIAQP